MKILMLADNYVPEIAAPSFRTHEHVCEWIAQGHDVTVVTGVPNWPHGKTFPGYRNRLFQEERIDGVRVIRVWTYMAANQGFVKRTLDYLSFMFSATFASLRLPACDVVVATSPQFFTAVAGWLIGTLRRRPWVFEVRDLWPESIKAVGVGSGRLIRALERLELFLYRRARRVIVVTESFRQNRCRDERRELRAIFARPRDARCAGKTGDSSRRVPRRIHRHDWLGPRAGIAARCR